MNKQGIDLIMKAILFVEKQKNISGVKRKLRMSLSMKKTHSDLMSTLKREKAINLGKKSDYYISPKAKKLSKFILEQVVVPFKPIE